MSSAVISDFVTWYHRYFGDAPLPIGFNYADSDTGCETPSGRTNCFIAELGVVRKGKAIAFSAATIRCGGGRYYTGFSQQMRGKFEDFLSCGIPGELEGERYKKSPELAGEHRKSQSPFRAPGQFLVFKRIDNFSAEEHPLAVIFQTSPDILSGLFTLANFDSPIPQGVIAPFCSGCSSIVYYPLTEAEAEQPRAILGMFDVSARPHVPANSLSFAVPWRKFVAMVENMPESFLITGSWEKVAKRISHTPAP